MTVTRIIGKKKEANGKNNLRKYAMKQRNITKAIKMETVKESTSHKRFLETTKLLLGADSDLCQYLKAVSEDDREMLEILEEFLADTYVKDQAVICEENIDQAKVNRVMDEFWDRAAENMNSRQENLRSHGKPENEPFQKSPQNCIDSLRLCISYAGFL